MFTIRVEHDKQNHEVYEGKRYSVTHGDDASILTIVNEGDPPPTPTKVVMQRGAVAYVMNVAGNTVDRIQTAPLSRKASMRQV